MKVVHFTLSDADAVEHLYDVELFGVAEQAALQLMSAQPILEVVGQLGRVFAQAIGGGAMTAETVMERLGGVDTQGLLKTLPAVPRLIEDRGGPELVTRIFRRTTRHSSAKDSAGGTVDLKMPLADASNQDNAFADGNMSEYWLAMLGVLTVNFTRRGRGESLSWKKLLSAATGGLLRPSSQSTATPLPSSDTKIASGSLPRQ